MVWGMTLPEGFGEFWPLGDFEYESVKQRSGWSSRLNVYYFQQSPEVQTELGAGRIMVGDYGFYVNGKFRDEIGTGGGINFPPLTPIREHEPPRSFDTEKGYKILGSLIVLNDSLLAVDERLKAIIERLEPDMHQFFPIEIRMPRGKIYPAQYYTLVVGQYFDAFSREDTELGSVYEYESSLSIPDVPTMIRLNKSKAALNGLAVRKAAFDNAHLWRDRTFGAELTCFSDALKAEIKKAGLRLPKHNKLMEV